MLERKEIDGVSTQHRTYIVDIDGTLADATDRLHHIRKDTNSPSRADWDAFFAKCGDDKPLQDAIDVIRMIGFYAWHNGNIEIAYLTGRPERVRQTTISWLMRYGLPKGQLLMREDADHRSDEVLKKEMLEKLRRTGTRIAAAFEDRPRVVKMWRGEGITCFQLCDEDF